MFDLSIGADGEPVLRDLTSDEIAAIPAPPRRLLPKSTVTARLIELGVIAETLAMLRTDPAAYARWFTPDWPEVFADDEGLLTFFGPAGLNLTQEQIDAVLAP